MYIYTIIPTKVPASAAPGSLRGTHDDQYSNMWGQLWPSPSPHAGQPPAAGRRWWWRGLGKTDLAKTGEPQKGVRSRISSEYPTLVTRTGADAGQCLHLYIY